MAVVSNAMIGLQIGSAARLLCPAGAQAQTEPPLTEEIERWMNAWMGATKVPMGALHLSRFKDPIYFLTKPISWRPNPGQEGIGEVHVPKGFVTDLTSVPRAFWTLLRPDGDYTYPAIIHDYLYWTQDISRQEADLVLQLAMEDFDIGTVTAATIYNAVRLGGQSAWERNAADKARGQKRILKRFPADPRITWSDWKMRSDVFACRSCNPPSFKRATA